MQNTQTQTRQEPQAVVRFPDLPNPTEPFSPGPAITNEQARAASLQYFGGQSLPGDVFLGKYALHDPDGNLREATPHDMHVREAWELARIEGQKFDNPLPFQVIFEALSGFSRIIPQGSPMFGMGNPYQTVSLANCFVADSPVDSYGGILRTDEQLVQICKRRGGVGTDVALLRPAGARTNNAAKTSTGTIPFMRRYSNSIREVAQNGRRGALMLSNSIHHPESVILLAEGEEEKPVTVINDNMPPIETTTKWYNPDKPDFASIKYNLKDITGANISLRLTDEFMRAVVSGTVYERRFPVDAPKPTYTEYVDARACWDKIIRAAWQIAEPGLLFWDNIIRESPADCYASEGFRTVCTNPCGEIPLSILDSCRLLAVNLFAYVRNPFTPEAYYDYDALYKDAQLAQRLADNIVDLEIEAIDRIIAKIEGDPEPEELKRNELRLWQRVRQATVNGRRTGTGITALADAIAGVGVKYGTQESVDMTERIYRTLKLGCYRASVDMAKELGPFPIWNHEKEKDNPFLLRIRDEDPQLWEDMRIYGRRNIAILTTAPTGSVSLMTQTSSGIEPLFMMGYLRNKKGNPGDKDFRTDFVDQNGDHWMTYKVYHPKIQMWMDITGETDDTKSPYFGACAGDLDWRQRIALQAAAQRHVDHAISNTVNIPKDSTPEDVAVIYEEAWRMGLKGVTVYRDGCRTGVLVADKKEENKEPEIQSIDAPKRPNELPCSIHHIKVKGEPFFVLVGLLGGKPYEVFAGKNGVAMTELPAKLNEGLIVKEKKGKYSLRDNNGTIVLADISTYLDEEQEGMTRLASTCLRHGADMHFVVSQLEKTKGNLGGFCKAMARALKGYIPDGTVIKGEECPECKGSEIIRSEGCILCNLCGWSKCA
jgi:ribonucleoside-diphosphate reductase alpha chain